jgi:hypothetical protein
MQILLLTYVCVRWKYMCGFMFDGKFTAEQLKMKNPEDDVHLTDGDAFFTTRKPYYDHLKVALEIREVRLGAVYQRFAIMIIG